MSELEHSRGRLDVHQPLEIFLEELDASQERGGVDHYLELLECTEDPMLLAEDDEAVQVNIAYARVACGDYEKSVGAYDKAIESYQTARRALEAQAEPATSYVAARKLGDLLVHEVGRPMDAVEPYETVLGHFQREIAKGHILEPQRSEGYMDLLAHLASAYLAAGQDEKLHDVGATMARLGALVPAVFGYNGCAHQSGDYSGDAVRTPIYEELTTLIKQANDTLGGIRRKSNPVLHKKFTEMDAFLENESFMAHAPAQRNLVRAMLRHFKALTAPTQDPATTVTQLDEALALTTTHDLYAFAAIIHCAKAVAMGTARQQDGTTAEVSLLHGIRAAERSMKIGGSYERVPYFIMVELLSEKLAKANDRTGLTTLKARVERLGFQINTY